MDKYIGLLLDGRYEILDQIGVGGMAVVYKARDRRLSRYVAVKILRDEFAKDADFKRRFEAESRTGAMLSHPNIVSVYDVSQYENIDYIVMELIDGMTLKDYMIQRVQLSWREALHFSTLIAKALEHAHSRGIIHRDIKPQNIMILRDGSAKVADFGIARISATQNTVTQEALGSVHYISPEQAKGANVDSRCDIYSLGVVMYEMLTGRLPYEGDTPVAVAVAHINSTPVMPREIDPNIPIGLEQIAMKAMTADLSKRYASADQMLDDLEQFRKDPEINFNILGAAAQTPVVSPVKQEPFNQQVRLVNSQPTGRQATGKQSTARQTTGNTGNVRLSGNTGKTSSQNNKKNQKTSQTGRIEKEPEKKTSKLTVLAGVLCILIFAAGIVFFLYNFFLKDLMAEATQVEVPSFYNLKYSDIIESNEYEDFYIVRGEDEYSSTIEAGYVISQNPSADKLVRPGAQVSLIVSKGQLYDVMPELVNSSSQLAEITLKALSVEVILVPKYEYSSDYVEGYVILQDPVQSTVLYGGETVTIWVSLGPEVEYFPMPDLKGKEQDEAVRILKDNGLALGEIKSFENEYPEGIVYAQSIAPNTEVTAGTQVSLQVSSGPVTNGEEDGEGEEEDPVETAPVDEPPPEESEPPVESEIPVIAPKQVKVEIVLPEATGDKTTVRVTVKLDKIEQFNEIVDLSEGMIECIVSGVGIKIVDVYFDDILNYSEVVDFTAS